jgi:hypothetical protein
VRAHHEVLCLIYLDEQEMAGLVEASALESSASEVSFRSRGGTRELVVNKGLG